MEVCVGRNRLERFQLQLVPSRPMTRVSIYGAGQLGTGVSEILRANPR